MYGVIGTAVVSKGSTSARPMVSSGEWVAVVVPEELLEEVEEHWARTRAVCRGLHCGLACAFFAGAFRDGAICQTTAVAGLYARSSDGVVGLAGWLWGFRCT